MARDPRRAQAITTAPSHPFCGVCGSFADEEPWREAARGAREAGLEFEAYAPVADEETLREMRPDSTTNVVRLWSLLGGVFGGFCAFAMTIWMSRDWPLVVGGKPIVSFPPFIDICFEMTVLYASFACMGSFFALGRLPHLTLAAAWRPEFGNDRFGLFFPCPPGEAERLRRRLAEGGAERTWAVHNPERGRLAPPVEPDAGGDPALENRLS